MRGADGIRTLSPIVNVFNNNAASKRAAYPPRSAHRCGLIQIEVIKEKVAPSRAFNKTNKKLTNLNMGKRKITSPSRAVYHKVYHPISAASTHSTQPHVIIAAAIM